YDPTRMSNVSVSLSGPIIKDKLTFFATARQFQNEGWQTGRNAYSTHGALQGLLPLGVNLDEVRTIYNEKIDLDKPWYSIDTVTVSNNELLLLQDNGKRDSSLVNMNRFETLSFQGNLELKLSSALRFN